jgi:hypothetical protein
MDIQQLRNYRLNLEKYPFYNNKSDGIALFDLILSFVGAYILDITFKLSNKLPVNNKQYKQYIYYLLVIPVGILVHHLIAHYRARSLIPQEITFLNKKLFSLEFNIYKILIIILLIAIYVLSSRKF